MYDWTMPAIVPQWTNLLRSILLFIGQTCSNGQCVTSTCPDGLDACGATPCCPSGYVCVDPNIATGSEFPEPIKRCRSAEGLQKCAACGIGVNCGDTSLIGSLPFLSRPPLLLSGTDPCSPLGTHNAVITSARLCAASEKFACLL
jgi:hypothetical protein